MLNGKIIGISSGFDPCDVANQALEDLIAKELAQEDHNSKSTPPPATSTEAPFGGHHSHPHAATSPLREAGGRLLPPGFNTPNDSFSQRRKFPSSPPTFYLISMHLYLMLWLMVML